MNQKKSIEALRSTPDESFGAELEAFIDEYFKGDIRGFAEWAGYSESRVRGYLKGTKPSKRFKIHLARTTADPPHGGLHVGQPRAILLDFEALLERSLGCERIFVFRTSPFLSERSESDRDALWGFLDKSPTTRIVLVPRQNSEAVRSVRRLATQVKQSPDQHLAAERIEVCELEEKQGEDLWRRFLKVSAAAAHIALVTYPQASKRCPQSYCGIEVARSIPALPNQRELDSLEFFAPLTTDRAEDLRRHAESLDPEFMPKPLLSWLEQSSQAGNPVLASLPSE